MPIYTYQCHSCGVRFERRQSFDDKPLVQCPECRKNDLRKVFVPAGIIFRGSGWYSTDHRSPSGQTGRSKSEEGGAESKDGSDSKNASESKPESSPTS
ncbi:MAG: zinc ribbon domain-containing protein [Chloroflexi bacterium]|nr:zinc ribbon domain-containing protein [Chloroflexota bacterium]